MVRKLARDDSGGVLVEATVMLTILFVFLLGAVDFLFAFYQWNAAAKAVQLGARIAAVSDPVDLGLRNLSNAGLYGVSPGDAMPANAFTVTCTGTDVNSGTCTCSGTCTGTGTYNAVNMGKIVFGRAGDNNGSCRDNSALVPPGYFSGMCHMFSRVKPQNVRVIYRQTGLGFAGRPDGPVPTITVELQNNLPFKFFFLGGLMGFNDIPIPAMTTVITGEDLRGSWPPP
jgi:Flp pilus assembly protein TadG